MLETTQHGSSPLILLTGLRRVGKTVLIKKPEEKFKEDYFVIYLDLKQSNEYQMGALTKNDIIKIFYDAILELLNQRKFSTTITRIEKFFKTNNIHIKNTLEFKDIFESILENGENYSKLVNFIIDLPQKIYEDNSDKIKGVIIFIDEIQILKDLGDELSGFLWYLRSKIQFQNYVTYLFSGSMSTRDELIDMLSGQEGAFGGRILNIEIKPFSNETTINYLKEKLPQLKLTEDAFNTFYELTYGIPYYVNIFANLMPKNIEINEKDTLNILMNFYHILYHIILFHGVD